MFIIKKKLINLMNKQLKMESRQIGMTDDRLKGFQKMRELKKSGNHRLVQVIKVRYS